MMRYLYMPGTVSRALYTLSLIHLQGDVSDPILEKYKLKLAGLRDVTKATHWVKRLSQDANSSLPESFIHKCFWQFTPLLIFNLTLVDRRAPSSSNSFLAQLYHTSPRLISLPITYHLTPTLIWSLPVSAHWNGSSMRPGILFVVVILPSPRSTPALIRYYLEVC